MIIYFFPNDDFAIVYCIDRMSLLDLKINGLLNHHFSSLKLYLMAFGSL